MENKIDILIEQNKTIISLLEKLIVKQIPTQIVETVKKTIKEQKNIIEEQNEDLCLKIKNFFENNFEIDKKQNVPFKEFYDLLTEQDFYMNLGVKERRDKYNQKWFKANLNECGLPMIKSIRNKQVFKGYVKIKTKVVPLEKKSDSPIIERKDVQTEQPIIPKRKQFQQKQSVCDKLRQEFHPKKEQPVSEPEVYEEDIGEKVINYEDDEEIRKALTVPDELIFE